MSSELIFPIKMDKGLSFKWMSSWVSRVCQWVHWSYPVTGLLNKTQSRHRWSGFLQGTVQWRGDTRQVHTHLVYRHWWMLVIGSRSTPPMLSPANWRKELLSLSPHLSIRQSFLFSWQRIASVKVMLQSRHERYGKCYQGLAYRMKVSF